MASCKDFMPGIPFGEDKEEDVERVEEAQRVYSKIVSVTIQLRQVQRPQKDH